VRVFRLPAAHRFYELAGPSIYKYHSCYRIVFRRPWAGKPFYPVPVAPVARESDTPLNFCFCQARHFALKNQVDLMDVIMSRHLMAARICGSADNPEADRENTSSNPPVRRVSDRELLTRDEAVGHAITSAIQCWFPLALQIGQS